MRPAVLLAHLTLWISSTQAFFPYTPSWMEDDSAKDRRSIAGRGSRPRFDIRQRTGQTNRPAPKRAAEDASRLASKYSRRSKADDGSLTKRQNQYDVMVAEDPGRNFSQGVDQDGTDYSYFIEAQLGSQGKKMYMLIDTGAGSSWVMGSSCSSKACGMHSTFGPGDSDTLKVTDKPFSIAYGSGKVSGSLVTDTITVAGMSFNYQFGLATTTSDQFVQFAFDGILGLGIKDGANENFLNVLDEADEVEENFFCVALNRASDGTNEGEITFGSTNEDKYTGDITYSDISHEDDWAINVDDFGYDGTKASAGGVVAYIDTGTSFIFGPEAMVKKLHDIIPGSSTSDGTTYTVPCDSDKPVTVTFSGVDYEISPKDWISPKTSGGLCTSNIYGHEVVKGAWLMGDTFLKNVYAVFDKDKRRIGFANNAITDGSSDTSSGSATKTSSRPSSTSASGSTKSSDVTALPDTTGTDGPGLGLGKESISEETATADASTASETKDNSSPTLSSTKFAFIACTISFFALMV